MMLPIVVLAGGLASRLWPMTESLPKSLLPIHGSPFVLHQLNLFKEQRITHVHYCLGHLGELIIDVIKNWKGINDVQITYSFDGEILLGTGGAINRALPYLPDVFFITYGDSYLNTDYKAIQNAFYQNNKEGLMTVFKNDNKFDKSNVVFINHEIQKYSKKQFASNMEYIDYGLGILQKKHFQSYNKDTKFDLAEIYEDLANSGKLLGFEIKERFYEIGSFQGIHELTNFLKPQKP